MFLAAYWVYIDGVNTVIQMAVDYGKSIGFGTADLILAVLLVQFVGVPAALLAGKLGERIGPRRAILIGLAVYVFVSIYATFMTRPLEFYLVAGLVGLVQGGVQLLSRSYFARLVPPERAGEFFGFYNMLGEFAAIIGPILVGTVSFLTGSPRLSILSVIVLFAIGAWLLRFVDAGKADERALARG
jgi:UMF1 family MFS transporter